MTRFDPEALFRALDDVRYVLIGGFAVIAHSRGRTTEDVDIVPAPDPDNLMALGNALVAMDARLLSDPERGIDPELRSALARGRSVTFATAHGEIDIVQRLPGLPSFRELDSSAIDTEVFGLTLRVASREALISMKRSRGSAQDLADIEALESA